MSNDTVPTSGSASASAGPNEVGRGSGRALNRRLLVKGAAWSVPVITTSAAVPAYASSCDDIVPGGDEVHATSDNLENALAALQVLVPTGAGRMHIEVVGGSGGGNYCRGARIEGDVLVSAGQTYSLVAGAGGETYAGGRGGQSLYGSGGRGGIGFTPSGTRHRGCGGGGASAVLLGSTAIAVAGGGGGAHVNQYPYPVPTPPGGDQTGRFSASLGRDATATFGSSSVTAFGGYGRGGTTASSMAGETGYLGWAGNRPSTSSDPTPSQIRMMSGGGRGGGVAPNSPGAGGVPRWVTGPGDFTIRWSATGVAGSGSDGGRGADNSTNSSYRSTGVAGGGGGGYSGGGGGSSLFAHYNPGDPLYTGNYRIAAAGGGGSSFADSTVAVSSATTDGRGNQSTSWGNMGFVRVTFYRC